MEVRTRIAIACLALASLAGCGHKTWVDLDRGGCDSARAARISDVGNQSDQAVGSRAIGMSLCMQAGKTFAGAFRCDGPAIQVACKD